MEKEKLKLPYEDAKVDVLILSSADIITASGGDIGDSFSESDSWT